MAHYVCTACKESAENPGFCQTPDCPAFGQELKECSCEDEQHKDVVGEEGMEGADDVDMSAEA